MISVLNLGALIEPPYSLACASEAVRSPSWCVTPIMWARTVVARIPYHVSKKFRKLAMTRETLAGQSVTVRFRFPQ